MERLKRDLDCKDHWRYLLIKKWNPTSLFLKYAQMTMPFTVLSFSFYRRGEDYLGLPSGYSKHTVIGFFHMATVDCIILVT